MKGGRAAGRRRSPGFAPPTLAAQTPTHLALGPAGTDRRANRPRTAVMGCDVMSAPRLFPWVPHQASCLATALPCGAMARRGRPRLRLLSSSRLTMRLWLDDSVRAGAAPRPRPRKKQREPLRAPRIVKPTGASSYSCSVCSLRAPRRPSNHPAVRPAAVSEGGSTSLFVVLPSSVLGI